MRVAGRLQTVEDIARLFAADGVDARVRDIRGPLVRINVDGRLGSAARCIIAAQQFNFDFGARPRAPVAAGFEENEEPSPQPCPDCVFDG